MFVHLIADFAIYAEKVIGRINNSQRISTDRIHTRSPFAHAFPRQVVFFIIEFTFRRSQHCKSIHRTLIPVFCSIVLRYLKR